MRVAFANAAGRDVENIIDYIALDSPAAAEKVYRAIVASAQRLADFPDIGRSGRLPGTRELQVPSLPYLIVHQVGTETVTVLAIFHSARDLVQALAERRKQTKQ